LPWRFDAKTKKIKDEIKIRTRKMRKLLMLVLVLGMASLANAAPQFIMPPETQPYQIDIYLLTSGVPELDVYIDYTPLIGVPYFDPFAATLTGVAPINALTVQTMAVDGYNMFSIAFASTGILTSGYMGTLHLNPDIVFTPEQLFVSKTLDVYDMDGNPAGTVSVLVVPEPATIALLCLGGLMLRRRK
jgi:hypothetical protein